MGVRTGDRLAAEYRDARMRVRSLLDDGDEDSGRRPVPACPAWTVGDLLAHLAGLAAVYGSGRVPEGDRQRWLDQLVVERRGKRLFDVFEEWDVTGPLMERALVAEPDRRWPLVYDVIAHEHDLRGALGVAGVRDDDAIVLGLQLGLRITASDLARHDLPGLRVLVGGGGNGDFVAGDDPVDLTLEASAFEAFRLLGSRRTLPEMRAAFTGDLDRYLPGLVHMQLPVKSLGEASG
jgi:Mycothiol maleylpyruvate isomerase N-terminal domain